MRFETCDQLIYDYEFYVGVIKDLEEEQLKYFLPDEIAKGKRDLIDECQRDFSFKILTKIEAEIRLNIYKTVRAKWRDPISRIVTELARDKRRRNEYQKSISEEAQRLRLEDFFLAVRDHFKENQHDFHRVCSRLKGLFSFRDWYAHGRYNDHFGHYLNPANTPDPYELLSIFRELEAHLLERSITRNV